MRKAGILGGTFNPVHWGHLLAAETALTQASLDRILWIPTSQSPYKPAEQLASFSDRQRMVQLAINPHPQFELAEQAAASGYAIDTLKALQQQDETSEWYWILGLDAFRSLPRWVGRRELIPLCTWLVAPRWIVRADFSSDCRSDGRQLGQWSNHPPDDPFNRVEAYCQQVVEQLRSEAIDIQWQLLQMPLVQLSSSLVRRDCQQNQSIRYLVPEAVREYIAAHHLYQERVKQ